MPARAASTTSWTALGASSSGSETETTLVRPPERGIGGRCVARVPPPPAPAAAGRRPAAVARCGAMRWVWRTVRRAVEARLTPEDDPPTRGEDEALLGLLRTQPGSTADELAEAAGAPAERVARQLQALEARGHVTEHDGRYRPVA